MGSKVSSILLLQIVVLVWIRLFCFPQLQVSSLLYLQMLLSKMYFIVNFVLGMMQIVSSVVYSNEVEICDFVPFPHLFLSLYLLCLATSTQILSCLVSNLTEVDASRVNPSQKCSCTGMDSILFSTFLVCTGVDTTTSKGRTGTCKSLICTFGPHW